MFTRLFTGSMLMRGSDSPGGGKGASKGKDRKSVV